MDSGAITGYWVTGFIALFFSILVGVLIWLDQKNRRRKLQSSANKPASISGVNKVQASTLLPADIDSQTRVGCITAFVVFILPIIISFPVSGGRVEGVPFFFFLLVEVGCIIFAIAWPIRGAARKKEIRQQLSGLSNVTLSSSGGRRIDYIPLPKREALEFVSDPTPSLLDIEVPEAVHNYVTRLISPVIAKIALEGWKLDEDKLYSLEPELVMIDKLVPFKKAKYRYEGVKVHLRRI